MNLSIRPGGTIDWVGRPIRFARRHGSDVWRFRWSETGGNARRAYRKRVIGSLDQYSDAVEARRIATGILAMPGPGLIPIEPAPMTIAELSKHFQHRELTHDDNWRSYSTRRNGIQSYEEPLRHSSLRSTMDIYTSGSHPCQARRASGCVVLGISCRIGRQH